MKRILSVMVVLILISALFVGCTSPEAQSTMPGETTAAPAETGTAPAETTVAPEQVASVSGGTSEADSPALGTEFGAIEIRVTDALKYGIEKVEVYFSEVRVHKAAEDPEGEGEWISLIVEEGSEDEGYFDLVALGKEGLEELLAHEEVTAGKYTQIRVVIDEPVWVTYSEMVEIEEEGEIVETKVETMVEAKLPSGELKFVHPFDVLDGTTTIITLDFIVEDSVIFTGSSQTDPDTGATEPKVIVKPVVKLSVAQEEDESPVGTVNGNVTDTEGNPIEGATVTVGDTGLSAETDENGDYEIDDVPVGTYDVSATADGYQEATQEDVEVSEDTPATVDFELEEEEEGGE